MKRRLVLIGIVIIELFLIFNCANRIISILQAQSRISGFKIQRDLLAQEYEEKSRLFEFVRTDTYVEKIAREKLGFAREGDAVYIIPGDRRQVAVLPKVELDTNVASGLVFGEVGNWWKLFFD